MRRRLRSFFLLALAATVPAALSAAVAASPLQVAKATLPSTGRQLLRADMDGDGSDEMLAVYGGKEGCRIGSLTLRRESGRASLHIEEIAVGNLPPLIAPLPTDADGDGTIDMLSAGPGGILFRKGSGGGNFEPATRLAIAADDLLMPLDGCDASPQYVLDIEGGSTPEIVIPIVGGVRVHPLPLPGYGAVSPDRPAPHTLLAEPRVGGSGSGVSLVSPLPKVLHGKTGRTLILGPGDDNGTGRLELAWWSEDAEGSLDRHRSALALPPGESAVIVEVADLEDDGRPEIIVLSAPSRLEKLFGEWRLLVYHAVDLIDAPSSPFFTSMTNINFWQLPSITTRPAPGGSDLLIAFYRGLRTAHLTIEVFAADGAGSFGARSKEVDLESGKDAERSLLIWQDVDSDGTTDLVTADDEGLWIHHGVPDRSRFVSREPFYASPILPPPHQISIGFQDSGGWQIDRGGPFPMMFFDTDDDGLSEIFVLGREESGGSLVEAAFLTPAAR